MTACGGEQRQAERPEPAWEPGGAAAYIAELRAAINGLGLLELAGRNLRTAHLDIDDVLGQTRKVADVMLETAECLLGSTATGQAYKSLVEERMIGLMEASGFQDLTGQRLNRIVHSLHAIEERLRLFAAHVQAQDGEIRLGTHELVRKSREMEQMLAGPGAPGAMTQDGIDELIRLAG
jgi:chemotaxis protein CheZ